MELEEALAKRISCRKFSETPLSKETIVDILKAGSQAPSPLNQQPWEFIVILSKSEKKKIYDVAVATKEELLTSSGKSWLAKYDLSFLERAPALVVVLADSNKIGLGEYLGERMAHVKAGSACVENMLLAAASRGLGSLWFTMYDAEKVRAALRIDPTRDIVGILPLGYPADAPRPSPKLNVEDKVVFLE